MTKQPSPRITHFAWGRLEVGGAEAPFKDAKLCISSLYPVLRSERDWSMVFSKGETSWIERGSFVKRPLVTTAGAQDAGAPRAVSAGRKTGGLRSNP